MRIIFNFCTFTRTFFRLTSRILSKNLPRVYAIPHTHFQIASKTFSNYLFLCGNCFSFFLEKISSLLTPPEYLFWLFFIVVSLLVVRHTGFIIVFSSSNKLQKKIPNMRCTMTELFFSSHQQRKIIFLPSSSASATSFFLTHTQPHEAI